MTETNVKSEQTNYFLVPLIETVLVCTLATNIHGVKS